MEPVYNITTSSESFALGMMQCRTELTIPRVLIGEQIYSKTLRPPNAPPPPPRVSYASYALTSDKVRRAAASQ